MDSDEDDSVMLLQAKSRAMMEGDHSLSLSNSALDITNNVHHTLFHKLCALFMHGIVEAYEDQPQIVLWMLENGVILLPLLFIFLPS